MIFARDAHGLARPLGALVGLALGWSAIAGPALAQTPEQAPRAMPLPPMFARPPERVPPPAPPKLLQDLTRKAPPRDEDRPLHGRVAPGYDLETVMRERGSGRDECRLDFDIADIGDHTFQTITVALAVRLKQGGTAKEAELPLVEPLEPDHRVTAQLEVSSPCSAIAEVRLRGFSQCTVDGAHLGTCRPLMLMRSNSRIRFGL